MRIVTLIENLVYQQGLFAEHGLSVYIETENQKIIFDTGQSGLFLQNAQKLGIAIEDIDCLVLSHGHYDHTGGLYPFLEKNSKAKVYAKSSIFVPKYNSKTRFIGTFENLELLKNRIVYLDTITKIAENVIVVPNVSVSDSTDTHFEGMSLKFDAEFVPDVFDDELFLVLKQDDQINIVTACSHQGISNICKSAIEQFKLPLGLILGGFHTKNCSSEQYEHIVHYFRQVQPKSIGVCHCTGVDVYTEFVKDLDSEVFYNYTGNEIILK